MDTLEHLQRRIASFEELRTIIRTMRALSMASIHQYQQAVASLRGYYRTVEYGLQILFRDVELAWSEEQTGTRVGMIVFGSDQGLCGRFNEDIAEYAQEAFEEFSAASSGVNLLAVGARLAGVLEQQGIDVEENFLLPGSAARITSTVQQILLKVDDWRTRGQVGSVHLFYNSQHEHTRYKPVHYQLAPVSADHFADLRDRPWPSRSLPTYTMDQERLLAALLHQYLFVTLFRACAESLASEHNSRVASMQAAEKNLDDRLEEVGAEFRRVRQDTITDELLDVVAGFEALTTDSS